MKFNNLKFEEEKKIILPSHKKNSIFEIEYSNIEKFFRYDNVGVILMKKGAKGNFRILSTLINNGEYPVCWSIRVHFTKSHWTISVAPHDTIDKNKYDINLVEFFKDYSLELKNIKYLGYKTYICFDEIKSKSLVEKIVNYVISELRDIRLEIVHPVLYLDFKKENSIKDFRIKSSYLDEDEEVSDSVYEKYLTIMKTLMSDITESEKIIVEKIGNRLMNEKRLPNENKEYLDSLSEKYISQDKRISISLRNLINNDFDED